MSEPINALGLRPTELIREASPEALDFYAHTLSGLYLPEYYLEENKDARGVSEWDVGGRLLGIFGSFEVTTVDGEEEQTQSMAFLGSTIGVGKLSPSNYLEQLKHSDIRSVFDEIIGKPEKGVTRKINSDYGSTRIEIDKQGRPVGLRVIGSSPEMGRANTEGRLKTVQALGRMIGNSVKITNVDPTPSASNKVLERA